MANPNDWQVWMIASDREAEANEAVLVHRQWFRPTVYKDLVFVNEPGTYSWYTDEDKDGNYYVTLRECD